MSHSQSFRRSVLFCLFFGGLVVACSGYDYSLLPPMNGLSSDFSERRAGKEVNASIRIGVTDEGLYRVTYASLTNAGVAGTNLVGSMMRLFCRTQEIAIVVSSSNLWTSSDYLLFPGVGFDGYYSMTNVYWLGFGTGGKRMASRAVTPIAGGTVVTTHIKTSLHHEDVFFRNAYRPSDPTLDHWMAMWLTNTIPGNVLLDTDQVITNTTAQFSAVMYGITSASSVDPDHCTEVKIGGQNIGRFLYDGQTTAVISTTFQASLLQATNTIQFRQIPTNGVMSDTAYLERCSVVYSRTLALEGASLIFDGRSGTNNYLVRGVATNSAIYALDWTDQANAVMLTGGAISNLGSGVFALNMGDFTSLTSRYMVCQATAIRDVSSVQRTYFRGLANTNRQADYVVICPYEFRAQVYRLLALRHSQGLSVAVAPLPDIYNEFGYGIADATVIKQFIGTMFHHWRSPPRYVLLAGTGTYDPRHHQSAAPDIIPAYQGPCYPVALDKNLYTALDNWYATVKKSSTNDYFPNVFLGRVPVENNAQLKNVIDKIVAFERVPTNDLIRLKALLVADSDDGANGLDFDAASEVLLNAEFEDVRTNVVTAYKGEFGVDSALVLSDINNGKFVVNYFGHGSAPIWSSSPNLLTVSLVINDLHNVNYPVVSMLTCLNGAFQDPDVCIVEAFMQGTNGASACVAASGYTSFDACTNVAHGFYHALLDTKEKRIGDCMEAAYHKLFLMIANTPEALFFELFGDPAMIVNP